MINLRLLSNKHFLADHIRDVLAVCGLLLIVGIFFYQTLLFGKLPVPSDTLVGIYHPWRDMYASSYPRGVPFKNFLITDPIRQQIPWRKLAVDEWKEGKIPWWNPYVFSGTPLVANPQAGSLYPLNVLFFFFDFASAWSVLIILEPLLAGLFLYMYLRHLRIHTLGAFIGALSWSFCGFMTAWLEWGTMAHVALWFPLILLAIDRLAGAVKYYQYILWAGFLAVLLSLQFLAGHPQVSLYLMVFSAGYAIVQSVYKKISNIHIVFFLISLMGFLAMTTLQWFWFMRFLSETGRAFNAEQVFSAGWFIPWQHLAQFVAPDFFGNPATMNYWGEWNYGEFVGYIGLLPFIAALYASVTVKGIGRYFFYALIASLLFILPTPIARLPYIVNIPLVSSLQPTRLMVVIDLCLSVLAAIGVHEFIAEKKKRKYFILISGVFMLGVLWAVAIAQVYGTTDAVIKGQWLVSQRNLIMPTLTFAAITIALAVFGFFGNKKTIRILVVAGVCVIVAADLLRFSWKFTPFTQREFFFPHTPTISFLQKQSPPFRVMSLDNRILPPNVASFYNIETVEGYDPVVSARYEEFIAAHNRKSPDINPPFGFNRIITVSTTDSPLFPLLGVRYVLTLGEMHNKNFRLVFQEGETRVYEYDGQLPRMFPVESAVSIGDDKSAIEALYVATFDPRKHAVTLGATPAAAPLSPSDQITVTSYSPANIVAQASLSEDRFIVILNTFDSRWRAYVDNAPVVLQRTNYVFQGLHVPKGTHTITLVYQ